MVAVVDADRCTGCGLCVDACLDQAISMDAIAVVDPARCIGCGLCVRECPNEALSFGHRAIETGGSR